MLLTITRPVMAHITTVSQKVAVIDTSACRFGSLVFAQAAAIAVEPSPASLVKRPFATPCLAAMSIVLPINPPVAAFVEKAAVNISFIAGRRYNRFKYRIRKQLMI